jgi:hypothetical protein
MTVVMAMPMPPPVMVVVPTAPMVAMAPVMMMSVPPHLGGRLLPGILLHRRRSARIDQRYSLCALERSRDHKQCADSCKTQNSRSDHPNSSSHAIHAGAVGPPSIGNSLGATREWNPGEGDVNDD